MADEHHRQQVREVRSRVAAVWQGAAAALPGCRLPHCEVEEGGEMIETIARWICRSFHRRITRAYHGRYYCLRCLRTYEAGYR